MMKARQGLAAVVIVGGLCVAAGLVAQSGATSSTSAGEWPSYAGDLQSTHYSPLSQIDASNFK